MATGRKDARRDLIRTEGLKILVSFFSFSFLNQNECRVFLLPRDPFQPVRYGCCVGHDKPGKSCFHAGSKGKGRR